MGILDLKKKVPSIAERVAGKTDPRKKAVKKTAKKKAGKKK